MRKQTKLAVVLAAAALLAVGSASIVSAAGWVQEGAEWRYQDASGDYVTDSMKKSGDTTFYLDENGYMAKDYFCSYNENYYYFGSNGAMVKNTWVAIDPSLVDNADEDADAYWFYFQDTGKAFKGGDSDVKKKKIDGKTYFFDTDGKMMTGWFDATGEKFKPDESNDFLTTTEDTYYCGEDGVARSGWLAWTDGLNEEYTLGTVDQSDRTVIYFYFNTSNFKRTADKEKTINGKKYRFDEGGVMYTGWEWAHDKVSTKSEWKYYSGEDDGHMVKKGWVYAVPDELLNSENFNDDTSKYFYFLNNGTMVTLDQKRINGKYYVFNKVGIMQTGLVFLDKKNEFSKKVDLEYTKGEQFVKASQFWDGEHSDHTKFNGWGSIDFLHKQAAEYSVHYYGTDGAKVTGNKIPVEFSDDTYFFASKNSGGFTGEKKSKFYSNGFLLKASDDIRLGLVLASDNLARQKVDFSVNTDSGDAKKYYYATSKKGMRPADSDAACYVVTTSGSQKKKGAYKDADGNYWLVNNNKVCLGIFNIQVKWVNTDGKKNQWKTNVASEATYKLNGSTYTAGKDGKDDTFIDFDCLDKKGEDQTAHLLNLTNDYCLNFYLDDITD